MNQNRNRRLVKFTSASNPSVDGKASHLRVSKEQIGEVVLLPGDPGRVELFHDLCDDFEILSENREYTVGTGFYRGKKISVCSTGIGAPSTEIAVIQLISLGVKGLIRIGGTGVLKEKIRCGSYIINTGAMRRGGASIFYAPPEYPAVASLEITQALIDACRENGLEYSTGICASVGSFYHGQGRAVPFESGYDETAEIERYRKLNILNLEMETETILTLSSLYQVHAGSICSVHCNRITDEWLVDNLDSQIELCKTALSGAARFLDASMPGNQN